MLISKSIEFDAGHRVPNHGSKCRNPHGHRYKIRVTVEGNLIEGHGRSDEGMVLDFGSLKSVMEEYIHDVFDHGFIVYEKDWMLRKAFDDVQGEEWKILVVPYIPTAENLAIAVWRALTDLRFRGLHEVHVWETPTSEASYHGEHEEPRLQAVAGGRNYGEDEEPF